MSCRIPTTRAVAWRRAVFESFRYFKKKKNYYIESKVRTSNAISLADSPFFFPASFGSIDSKTKTASAYFSRFICGLFWFILLFQVIVIPVDLSFPYLTCSWRRGFTSSPRRFAVAFTGGKHTASRNVATARGRHVDESAFIVTAQEHNLLNTDVCASTSNRRSFSFFSLFSGLRSWSRRLRKPSSVCGMLSERRP